MATNPPAPPNRVKTKGDPPARAEIRDNLSKPEPSEIVALNFRVPAEFKKDFKIAAATYGITQSELLQQLFKEWRQRYG
jgi:hypothetical protein